MVLANGEQVYKTWEYEDRKANDVKASLTVTNKRIVSMTESNNRIFRQEVPLEEVKSFSCSHQITTKNRSWFLILLGILAIGGACFLIYKKYDWMYSIPALVLGVIFLLLGLRHSKSGDFFLKILTKGPQEATMKLGIIGLFKKGAEEAISVKCDVDVANDIINTLGAYIIEGKMKESK